MSESNALIDGTIERQMLRINKPHIVAGSVYYITAHFDMDENWEGCTVIAHFAQGDTVYDVEVDSNGDIDASSNVMLTAGTWNLYLHGYISNGSFLSYQITTNIVALTVAPTGNLNGGPVPPAPTPPTPSTNISGLASEYSDEETYVAGQLVIKDNTLYKAKQDIDTPEAWNSAHWEEAIFGDEINLLQLYNAETEAAITSILQDYVDLSD